MAGLRVTTVTPEVEYGWKGITRQQRDQLVAELRVAHSASPWVTVELPQGTKVHVRREHIVSIEEW